MPSRKSRSGREFFASWCGGACAVSNHEARMQISSFETRAEYRRVAQDDEEERSRVAGTLGLMGKITGFLEIDRHDRKYAPVTDRVQHYREFVIPLSEKDTRDQAARCMNCGIPYCHGTGSAQPGTPGCPVNNQIPDFNDLVYQGNWEEASRNLHSTNNFPEFTGRICPAPCEASCTLNIDDNSHVGADGNVDPREMLNESDAVALTGGAEAPRDLPIPGREFDGINYAMDFLPQQNR